MWVLWGEVDFMADGGNPLWQRGCGGRRDYVVGMGQEPTYLSTPYLSQHGTIKTSCFWLGRHQNFPMVGRVVFISIVTSHHLTTEPSQNDTLGPAVLNCTCELCRVVEGRYYPHTIKRTKMVQIATPPTEPNGTTPSLHQNYQTLPLHIDHLIKTNKK